MAINDRNVAIRNGNRRQANNTNNVRRSYNIETYDIFIRYVLSSNQNITLHGLNNLRTLITNHLDNKDKDIDDNKKKKITIISKGLEARIDYNIDDKSMILQHINGGLLGGEPLLHTYPSELKDEEIKWVDETVSGILSYTKILSYSSSMMTLGSRLKSEKVSPTLLNDFKEFITTAYNDLIEIEPKSATLNTFSLKNDVMREQLTHTYNMITSPSNKLRSGMVGLNALLKGGFEKGRVYSLFGVTGGGKSLLLLNLAYQMKMFNNNYKTKDPTKTPTIVYITMENNIEETVDRLYKIITGNQNMGDYDREEVIEQMSSKLYCSEESPINLYIEYVTPNSVDTNYIHTVMNRNQDEEVICIIHDHLKKINSSTDNSKEDRIKFGDIINQFKAMANLYKIPIITNSHLNRDANRRLEEAASKNRVESVRCITRDMIGESFLILDNTDVGIGIAVESGYMGIKLLKSRNGQGLASGVIFQPFEQDSLALAVDVNAPQPVYKQVLMQQQGMNGVNCNQSFNIGQERVSVSPYSINSISDLISSPQTVSI